MRGYVSLEVDGDITGRRHFVNKQRFRDKKALLIKRAGYPKSYTLIIEPDDDKTHGQDIISTGVGDMHGDNDSISMAMQALPNYTSNAE